MDAATHGRERVAAEALLAFSHPDWWDDSRYSRPHRSKGPVWALLVLGVVLLIGPWVALVLTYAIYGEPEDESSGYYWQLFGMLAWFFVLAPAGFVSLIAAWVVWWRSEPAAREPSPAATGEPASEPAAAAEPAVEGVGCVSSPLPLAVVGFLVVAFYGLLLADLAGRWWTLPYVLAIAPGVVAIAMAARNLITRRRPVTARLWDGLAAVLGAASVALWIMSLS